MTTQRWDAARAAQQTSHRMYQPIGPVGEKKLQHPQLGMQRHFVDAGVYDLRSCECGCGYHTCLSQIAAVPTGTALHPAGADHVHGWEKIQESVRSGQRCVFDPRAAELDQLKAEQTTKLAVQVVTQSLSHCAIKLATANAENERLEAELAAEQKMTANIDRLTGENIRLRAELEEMTIVADRHALNEQTVTVNFRSAQANLEQLRSMTEPDLLSDISPAPLGHVAEANDIRLASLLDAFKRDWVTERERFKADNKRLRTEAEFSKREWLPAYLDQPSLRAENKRLEAELAAAHCSLSAGAIRDHTPQR